MSCHFRFQYWSRLVSNSNVLEATGLTTYSQKAQSNTHVIEVEERPVSHKIPLPLFHTIVCQQSENWCDTATQQNAIAIITLTHGDYVTHKLTKRMSTNNTPPIKHEFIARNNCKRHTHHGHQQIFNVLSCVGLCRILK